LDAISAAQSRLYVIKNGLLLGLSSEPGISAIHHCWAKADISV